MSQKVAPGLSSALSLRSSVRRGGSGAGVYVHFPFCLAKCPYCDFTSYAAPREAIDHAGYADAVLREIDRRAPSFVGRHVESIFFGGGTPSLWEPLELGRVLRHALASLAPRGEVEVTVECNPTSLDEDRAAALVAAGVNRLSIGVQSLRDDRLRFLGRLHDSSGARAAVRDAIRADVPRVSADLIFGLPDQSVSEACDEALELQDLGLRHMSCYQLTIEPGTRFGELARRGRLPLADEGRVADAFLAVGDALDRRGLRHYEVSNFAEPGEEARHNLGYWRGDEYLGLGCAAVGFLRKGSGGVRYRNDPRPERYVEATRTPGCDLAESSERLEAEALMRERIMLGLRVAEGVDIEAAARDLSTPGWTSERTRTAQWLEERGRIVRDGSRVLIPPDAWLWADDTAARLF
jgi:putative oxygen-independent coproporphyrinogen III oxidase